MKKLNLLYVLFLLVAVVACKKDSEDPTFKKEAFVGINWQQNDSEQDGCTTLLKFTDTQYFEGEKCDGGANDYGSGQTYTFDGKRTIVLSTILGDMKYVISSLNTTTLKVDVSVLGQNAGTYTYTKID
jgi:hypothetical protein